MTVATPKLGDNRPPSSLNRTTTALKGAILQAATDHGHDGAGADGLAGYLLHLAETEPRSYAGLLGKVLPLEVGGQLNVRDAISKEQRDAAVAAAMRADG